MKYEFATLISALKPGEMKPVAIDGHKILLANIDGTFHAVSQKCTHFGANLCNGALKNGVVTCPKHGAQFDVRSGEAVGKANMLIFKMQPKDLRTYAVKVNGDEVLIGV